MRLIRSLMLLVLLTPGLAAAGRLTLEADPPWLPAGGEPETLRAAAAGARFDALVIVTAKRGVEPQFSEYLAARVGAPKMVVLGIDPEHRKMALRYGTGTGLTKVDADRALGAARPHFKRADWLGGAAATLRSLSTPVPTPAPAPAVEATGGLDLPLWAWILIASVILLLLFGALVTVAQAPRRRSSASGAAGTYYRPGSGSSDSGFVDGLLIGSMLPGSTPPAAAPREEPSRSSSSSSSDSDFFGGGSSGGFGGGGFDGGGSSGDF
mgnify:CR=1 FL=1